LASSLPGRRRTHMALTLILALAFLWLLLALGALALTTRGKRVEKSEPKP
jgi:hypothetical protein